MRNVFACSMVLAAAVGTAQAQVFSDAFNTGSSLLWGNERGQWTADGGLYFAQVPNNNPLTYTSLPYEMTDLVIRVAVKDVTDGGVWVHADAAGQNGVLLVLAHRDVYWHVVVNGNPGPAINSANDLYNFGDDFELRVQVSGNNYWAFLPGFGMPVTTMTNPTYPSGRVGLYDFSGGAHDYDSVVLEGDCVGGCCPALISYQPRSKVICANASDAVAVAAAGTSVAYQWQIAPGDDPLNFMDLSDGPFMADSQTAFTVSGAQSASLGIDAASPNPARTWRVRCVVDNACGDATSDAATLRIGFPADLTGSADPNDAAYGVSDGNVDAADFFYYLDQFVAANLDAADLSGSSDPNALTYGVPDGSIDAADFFYYLDLFVAGCP